MDKDNSVYDSRENCNALIGTASNVLIKGCKNTVIPSSVTGIGASAFYGCTGLTKIDIPESVTSIGEFAFNNCALKSITIPANVDSIGAMAFRYCRNLNEVTSLIENPFAINEDVFYSSYVDGKYEFTSATLYVPIGTKALYEATEGWNKFHTIVEIETPSPIITGDANSDGTVDAADIVAIVNKILDNSGDNFNEKAADVNGDGVIDVSDVVAVVNIILKDGSANSPEVLSRVRAYLKSHGFV